MKKICKNCGGKFEGVKQRRYCSTKCKSRFKYRNNIDKYRTKVKKWREENPDKFKKSWRNYVMSGRFNNKVKENYYKNKEKWKCRNLTRSIFQKLDTPKICKRCGSKENIEIHHEIYPKGLEEIRKAISKNLIYYLCRPCHRRKGTHR